jgi:hypothetical protein
MHRMKLVALAAIAAVVAVPSAQAHKGDGSSGGWKVVASGLDNPRGISIGKHGDIWVAEAGRGGPASSELGSDGVTPVNCQPGEEGGLSCFGTSGAFTRIHHGDVERVVTGLPSFGDPDTGDGAIGPSDIVAKGRHVTGMIGGGGGADERAAMGDDAALFDTLLEINPWSGDVWPIADFAQYETDNNPDKGEIDSDSYGLARTHDGYIVADAAGNDVLGVERGGDISTLAVFPTVNVPAPAGIPDLPPTIDMQAVPTSVAIRPHDDDHVYVGQLTGFPFPPGAASVWKVDRDGGDPTVFATGFTNIVDIAFGRDCSLYVLEIAANGLLSGDTTGALIRVSRDGKHQETVASDGLVDPTGVAIAKNGDVYVTNYGTSAGKGEVVNLGKV